MLFVKAWAAMKWGGKCLKFDLSLGLFWKKFGDANSGNHGVHIENLRNFLFCFLTSSRREPFVHCLGGAMPDEPSGCRTGKLESIV